MTIGWPHSGAIAATYGRFTAAASDNPAVPIQKPQSERDWSAFFVAWNRGCGAEGYLNRRKRRWLAGRLVSSLTSFLG